MKRKKFYFRDLVEMGINYHRFTRVTNRIDKSIKGYRYDLDTPLTGEQIDYIRKFKNVEMGYGHYLYTPENKVNFVIILDKCKAETY